LAWRRDQQQPADNPVNRDLPRALKALHEEGCENVDYEIGRILPKHGQEAIEQAEAADAEP